METHDYDTGHDPDTTDDDDDNEDGTPSKKFLDRNITPTLGHMCYM